MYKRKLLINGLSFPVIADLLLRWSRCGRSFDNWNEFPESRVKSVIAYRWLKKLTKCTSPRQKGLYSRALALQDLAKTLALNICMRNLCKRLLISREDLGKNILRHKQQTPVNTIQSSQENTISYSLLVSWTAKFYDPRFFEPRTNQLNTVKVPRFLDELLDISNCSSFPLEDLKNRNFTSLCR